MCLDDELSKGISFKKFLMIAFRLDDEAFAKLHSQASGWTMQDDFVKKLHEYKTRARNRCDYAMKAAEELGNLVLEKAMCGLRIPKERQVKLICTDGMDIPDGRQPDYAIVPITACENDIVNNKRFSWSRVLGAIQLWLPAGSKDKKRKSASSAVIADEPPAKRSRTLSSQRIASAPQPQSTVDAGADAQFVQTSFDAASLFDTTNNCSIDSDSTSRWKSDATLCKVSAERELVQLASDAFSSKGDRTHTIGACIYGTKIKLQFCSHSGIVESDMVDFTLKPELLAIFLAVFATSSMAELGFNMKTGYFNPFNVDDIESRRVRLAFESSTSENNQPTQPRLNDIRIDEKIIAQPSIIGRATTVYRLAGLEYSPNLVMKSSWQLKTHRREDDIIRAAREVDPVHIPELFGAAVADVDSPLDALREACRSKSKSYEPRELRVLVMREYNLLSELGFGDEFWDAYAQLLECESCRNYPT